LEGGLKRFCRLALGVTALGVALYGALGCGGGKSGPVPTPILTNIFPSNVTAGSQGFTLFISGNDFISDNQGVTFAYWNGSARSTILDVQTGQLAVQILPSDVASPGIATITVANPPPGGACDAPGGTCGNNTFTIVMAQPGDPVIGSFSPASAQVGGKAFTLTVNGSNFAVGDVAVVNAAQHAATFVNQTQMTVDIAADELTVAGFANIAISKPNRVNASPSMTFPIIGPSTAKPSVNSLAPSRIAAGSADFQMTVSGSGFASNAVVEWNGSPRGTSFISGSQLVVLIPAGDVAISGTDNVSVTNPTTIATPGGGTSGTIAFTVSH
jgi:hypothetical protein